MNSNQKSADIAAAVSKWLFLNNSPPVRVTAKNTAPDHRPRSPPPITAPDHRPRSPAWSPVQVSYWEGQSVRILGTSDEPLFVAVDVCEILGLSNSRPALASLDDGEKGITKTDTLGGSQSI